MQADLEAMKQIQAVLFFALLFTVSVWDIRYRIIPDEFQAAIALLVILDFSVENLCGILHAVPYLGVALCAKKHGIGGGDVKLAASIGIVLGWSASVAASILGLSGFAIYGLLYERLRKKSDADETFGLPVGPFLGIGAVCAYAMKHWMY